MVAEARVHHTRMSRSASVRGSAGKRGLTSGARRGTDAVSRFAHVTAMPRFRQPARLSGAEDIHYFARDRVRVEARRLREAEPGAREGDVEGVHRLRVAIRRARATLALFAPVIRRPAHLDAELQWLGHEVGRVRDLDVLAAAVTTRGHKLEPPWREALVPLVTQLRERRQTAHEAFVVALDGQRARRTIGRLDAL